MRTAGFVLALLLAVSPAAAQQKTLNVNGQWHARVNVNGNVIDTVVVINGQQYSLTTTEVTAQGYQYATGQSGQFYFTPPSHLGFQVLDWSPKDYLGQPQSPPPNSNVTIVQFDDRSMLVTDDLCMADNGNVQRCGQTFYREL